ncbi:MAG TPA: MBL fold metallo-hydrolase, partial [Actinomycetota bacterium]|nr:MBL fold metallo-hydrolase [Actinomycetota bacterium]
QVAEGIQAIDTEMFGRDRMTSAYLVEAREPAIVETGPTTSVEAVRKGLEALGVGPNDLAHIVVTHIHLDHAGGAGALAPHFPRAAVWVHERGAPHLADPTKLVASASRVYGETRLQELFGPVHPVPADRLRSLRDGDRVPLGDRDLEALYTPGHAGHHVALADSASGGIFVGDAVGVFLPDVGVLRPATPPPEFDLELAVGSVERIAGREPPLLLFSHFGPSPKVADLCRLAIDRLRAWTDVVAAALRETDQLPEVVKRLRTGTADDVRTDRWGEDTLERYELLSSYEMNAMGLIRYLEKSRAVGGA